MTNIIHSVEVRGYVTYTKPDGTEWVAPIEEPKATLDGEPGAPFWEVSIAHSFNLLMPSETPDDCTFIDIPVASEEAGHNLSMLLLSGVPPTEIL